MLLFIVDFTSWQIGRNQIRRKWLEPFRAGSSWVDSEASLPISHPLWGHIQQKYLKKKKSPDILWGHIQQKYNPKSRLLNKYWANVFKHQWPSILWVFGSAEREGQHFNPKRRHSLMHFCEIPGIRKVKSVNVN